ncbi:hypothetical protein OIU78_024091 [Salix suchowensis]|nr:hypothetical protein OIU78_024091 [Salix suchowensis]
MELPGRGAPNVNSRVSNQAST